MKPGGSENEAERRLGRPAELSLLPVNCRPPTPLNQNGDFLQRDFCANGFFCAGVFLRRIARERFGKTWPKKRR
jgi:hypothetical protein